MVKNRILRENARTQLDGNIFKRKWMTMLGVCSVLPVIELAISAMPIFGVIALIVLSGPVTYGVARATVRLVEGEDWDFSTAFCAFSERFGPSVLLGFLQGLFTFLWTLLLIVPGLIKSYSYAMAFYIQQDSMADREPVDCITESRKMMAGHKWQLFCLDFSFLGWYILGALCLGIGVFFVAPYHQTARANFYEALKADRVRACACVQLTIGDNYD